MNKDFTDETIITVISGNGGNGCSSFYRGPNMPNGGPDGGHGGKGGDIIIESSNNVNTLHYFRKNKIFKAENGGNGAGDNRTGKSGKDIVIVVPIGTQIFDETGELMLADVSCVNYSGILIKGGNGGAGNVGFKNSTNQSPTIAFDGEKGITAKLILKLKLLSDVGIIGLPNVGKSTLLSVCSSSKTKVADYAFTTLYPELGVIFLSDYEDFVMADLPGLIEGASNGLGCGIRFLKHVERCSVLLHVLDGTSKDPLLDYYTIRKELSLYSSQILDKPEIIAISKIDEIDDFLLDEIKRKLSSSTSRKIYAFSSIIDDSIVELMHIIYKEIKKIKSINVV